MKVSDVLKSSWDLILLILCGCITLIFHQLRMIPDTYIPGLILLILCVLSGHEILEKIRRKEEFLRLQQSYETNCNSLRSLLSKDVEAQVLDNRPEFYRRLINSVKDARSTIDITNFTPQPPIQTGIRERLKYFETVADVVKTRENVRVRRVVSITTEHKWKWICHNQLEGFKNCMNFHLGYYDFLPKHIPLYTIILIDRREIFLGIYWEAVHQGRPDKNIWIRGEDVCSAFADYYDLLWDKSTILKEGPFINRDELKKIALRFKRNMKRSQS